MTDALVLLHAFPVDARMWQPQVEAIGADIPKLAPNFPGFGGTPGVGPVMRMEDAVAAAREAVEEARAERVILCGLSMGGYVALEYWRRHRDQVAGMVLANTRSGPDDDAARSRRRDLADRLEAEGSAFMVEDPPPLLSSAAPEGLWDRVKAWIGSQPAQAIAAASRGMAERPDSTGDLPEIDVPVLVVTSTGDTLILPEASSPMAEHLPQGSLSVIEGAGHLSNLEAPNEFNRLLVEHLAACGVDSG